MKVKKKSLAKHNISILGIIIIILVDFTVEKSSSGLAGEIAIKSQENKGETEIQLWEKGVLIIPPEKFELYDK